MVAMLATASASQKSDATGAWLGGSVGSPSSEPTRARFRTVSSGRRRKPSVPSANSTAKSRSQRASARSGAVRGEASGIGETATAILGLCVHEYLERSWCGGAREGRDRVVERIHRVDERCNRHAADRPSRERGRKMPAAGPRWSPRWSVERQPGSVPAERPQRRALLPHAAVERALRPRGDRLRAVGRVLGRVGGCLDASRRVLGARGGAFGALIGAEAGHLLRAGGRGGRRGVAGRGRVWRRRLLRARLRAARERRHLLVRERANVA